MPALLIAALLQTDAGAPVTVHISGVRDGRGLVRVEVCSARTWLRAGCEFTVNAPAQAGEMTVVVPDVPPGAWAVQAYHDRNGNKEVDRGPLGIPAEAEYVAAYDRRTGRAAAGDDWDIYIVFNLFRLAAIIQGIAKRSLEGTASDPAAAALGAKAAPIAERGWEIAQRAERRRPSR